MYVDLYMGYWIYGDNGRCKYGGCMEEVVMKGGYMMAMVKT
jgi:hypothetical protein